MLCLFKSASFMLYSWYLLMINEMLFMSKTCVIILYCVILFTYIYLLRVTID